MFSFAHIFILCKMGFNCSLTKCPLTSEFVKDNMAFAFLVMSCQSCHVNIFLQNDYFSSLDVIFHIYESSLISQ